MIDPKRLSDTTESDVERALLRAGQARAPKGAKARALLVASGAMAASSLAGAGAAAEAAATSAKVATTLALKWIGSLGVVGVVAMTSAVALRSPAESAQKNAVAAHRAPAPPRGRTLEQRHPQFAQALPPAQAAVVPTLEPPPTVAPVVPTPLESPPTDAPEVPTPLETPPTVAAGVLPWESPPTIAPVVPPLERAPTVETAAQLTAPPSPRPLAGDVRPASYPTSSGSGGRQAESPSPTASTLHAEIDLLNAARVALSAGDRPRALELLEGFETQFPEGVLRPEAAILRLDALVASGDRPAAARVARAFLAANPSSPYAPRIQRLMSQSNP